MFSGAFLTRFFDACQSEAAARNVSAGAESDALVQHGGDLSTACGLARLPEEVIDAVCVLVGGSSQEGAVRLGQLSGTCAWLHRVATSPAVTAGVASCCAAPESLSSSLRYLALHQAVATTDSNHVQFQAAAKGIEQDSQEKLATFAKYLHRYPDMTIMVDTHCGGTGAALTRKEERAEMQLSSARAEVVVAFLTARGVDGARIKTSAWGATITEATPGASICFEVDGLVVPPRPEYYAAALPSQTPTVPTPSSSAPPSPPASRASSSRSSSPERSAPVQWTPAALRMAFKTVNAREQWRSN